MLRLSFPRRGLATLSWSPTETPGSAFLAAAEALSKVPGVKLEGCVLSVPRTAWGLEAFWETLRLGELVDAFDDKVPVWGFHGSAPPAGLYPWQVEAVRAAHDQERVLLAFAMGLGKTRAAIAAVQTAGLTGPAVIVAPSFTVDVWRRELLTMGAIEREEDLVTLRSRDFRHASWRADAAWYFVHYDVVHAWSTRIATLKPAACVVDEIHWVKNPSTLRSKGTRIVLGAARLRIGLTGTPMDNSPADLHAPLEMLTGAWSWGSLADFRRRYAGAVSNGFGLEDRGPANIDELQTRLSLPRCYLRRSLGDAGAALPVLMRERVIAPMTEKQHAAHDRMLEGRDLKALVRAIYEGRAGADTIRLITGLMKVGSRAKRKTTLALVRETLAQGEPVVLFSWERQTALYFAEQLGGVAVTGSMPQAARDEVIRAFQAGTGAPLLSATYGTLREGVTLTRARVIVLHDLDWRANTLLQAEARVHRLGQQRGCVARWVLAEGSIDILLARALIRKAEWMEQTLGFEAAAGMVGELDLGELLPKEEDPAEWARNILAKGWY